MTSPFPKALRRFGRRNPVLVESGVAIFLLAVILVLGRFGAWP